MIAARYGVTLACGLRAYTSAHKIHGISIQPIGQGHAFDRSKIYRN